MRKIRETKKYQVWDMGDEQGQEQELGQELGQELQQELQQDLEQPKTEFEKFVETVTNETQKLTNEFGVPVTLHTDISTIPIDDLYLVMEALQAKRRVYAWYSPSNNSVHFYLPHQYLRNDLRELQADYFHEVVGHYGLRDLLGDKFNDVMLDFFNQMPPEMQQSWFDDYRATYDKKTTTDEQVKVIVSEEVISTVAQKGDFNSQESKNIIQKIVEAIKKFFKGKDLYVRAADIEKLANDYLRQSAENLRAKTQAETQAQADTKTETEITEPRKQVLL